MRIPHVAIGPLLMLTSLMCAGQEPVHFNYVHVPRAEEDHTQQPGSFGRYKILSDQQLLSADVEASGKKLDITFHRYDRTTSALIAKSTAVVTGEFPRFERLLHVKKRIYLLFTTREEKTHYKVYAIPWNEETRCKHPL